jgi:phosphoribosylformimino-5-aminoimidazole carboxamide ribotide isomerase
MRVIPVIDLRQGQVVRGIAGRRSEYRPIVSQIAGDARPAKLARALVERFGFDTAYIADLDAIECGKHDTAAWREIAAAGLRLWLDAGVGSLDDAAALAARLDTLQIDADIVVGLESLTAIAEIAPIVGLLGAGRVVFSLDLQAGQMLTRIAAWKSAQPQAIAAAAMNAGIRRLIVLDLADVGTGGGTRTLALCAAIGRQFPAVELIAGGGIRGPLDVASLAAAGCSAALVASALHDGRLTAADLSDLE